MNDDWWFVLLFLIDCYMRGEGIIMFLMLGFIKVYF